MDVADDLRVPCVNGIHNALNVGFIIYMNAETIFQIINFTIYKFFAKIKRYTKNIPLVNLPAVLVFQARELADGGGIDLIIE